MKHVLSVFVENQTGVLVRVVSMFSRREFNIDSLSVGVTEAPEFSRITMVVHGDENLIEQMIKQLEKMPVVRAVQRLDEKNAVCRGMTLIKVKADDQSRLDVLRWRNSSGLMWWMSSPTHWSLRLRAAMTK